MLADWERNSNPNVDRKTDLHIIALLESSNHRVVRVTSIDRMHAMLAWRSFDAVLISRRYVDQQKFPVLRHLQESHSEHSIIVWDLPDNETITCRIFSNQELASSANPAIVRIMTDAKAVVDALEIAGADSLDGTQTTQKTLTAEHQHGDEPDLAGMANHELHHKLALVLGVISASGKKGADIGTISDSVWGTSGKNRKKDIQVYVSKLRNYLASKTDEPYTIQYDNKRYFLMPGPRVSSPFQKKAQRVIASGSDQ